MRKNFKSSDTNSLQDLLQQLEDGIKELFNSDKYKNYLKIMSKFSTYSQNNIQLIFQQKPNATLIAGYQSWKRFDRFVKSGEKGIRIIAPIVNKQKIELNKIDPITQKPKLDSNGEIITEDKEIISYKFKSISVFDISQTDGKELEINLVNTLNFNVSNYKLIRKAIEQVSPVSVNYHNNYDARANGYFSPEKNEIFIKDNLSESQTIKTLVHEITHAKLHKNYDDYILKKEKCEIEAESVAYCVCNYLNIDASDYSFGYIANWDKSNDLKVFKNSLEIIHQTSQQLIDSIDNTLKTLEIETKDIQHKGLTRLEEKISDMIENTKNINLEKSYGVAGFNILMNRFKAISDNLSNIESDIYIENKEIKQKLQKVIYEILNDNNDNLETFKNNLNKIHSNINELLTDALQSHNNSKAKQRYITEKPSIRQKFQDKKSLVQNKSADLKIQNKERDI